MEALQFDPQKKVLSLVKTDEPTIKEQNEVIVKVAYAGVCGTDLHIVEGSIPCLDRPFIPGHEFCGVVTSVGSEVKHVKSGDRVVVDPNSGCGVCPNCVGGKYHLCPIGCINSAIGIFRNGGWAEFCKAPDHQVHLIPDSVTFRQAVLCEPISCVCHGWDRIAPVPIGSTILVSGAGIIGNLWTSLLHHSGHRRVIILESSASRRTLNQQLNTGYQCIGPEEVESLKKADPDWGVDICIGCRGNGASLQQGISLLAPGGKFCVFGVARPETTISISPFEIFKKELTIVGALINQFSFHKALGLIEAMGSRYLDFEKLGIKTYSLDQHQEAFEALKKSVVSKAVFKLPSGPD